MFAEHPHTASTLHWGWGRIIAHLHDDHGIDVPMAWTVGQAHEAHLKAHQSEASEETPMTQTEPVDIAPAGALEALARALYVKDADGPQPDWDDLGQETRDRYRDRARINLAAKRDSANAKVIAAERAVDVARQEGSGTYRIKLDRIVCALAGIDFDQVWVQDDSLSLRGAVRSVYDPQAAKLLRWLEHGGAMSLPGYASLGTDLESVTRERDDLRDKLRSLTEDRDQLAERLDMTQTASTNLQKQLHKLKQGNERNIGSIDALETRLADTEAERDRLRDFLNRRTQALDEGRDKLREIITDLKKMDPRDDIQVGPVVEWLESVLCERASTAESEPEDDLAEAHQELLDWAKRFAAGG
jgi:hypothetical protein